MIARRTLVIIHRWIGLSLALFLLVAGLTGSILAFQREIDTWLNPTLFRVEPRSERLAPEVLKRIVEVELLEGRATVPYFPLETHEGEALELGIEPRRDPQTGDRYPFSFDTIFVDPYRGIKLGERMWGAVRFDAVGIIPFIYKLHYSLALPEPWGTKLFGAAALLWILDCFVGMALTVPRGSRDFVKRWAPSWKVQLFGSTYRLVLDLHRALSLWLWGFFLLYAVSAVMFNLHDEVYAPALRTIVPYSRIQDSAPSLETPVEIPQLPFSDALVKGRTLMREWAKRDNFLVQEEYALAFIPTQNLYRYRVKSSLDLPKSYGQTVISFDADEGRVVDYTFPSVDTGNQVSLWLASLHMGKVFGGWYQAVVSLLGGVLALVTSTGVVIWAKKRRRRRSSAQSEPSLELRRAKNTPHFT